MTANCPTAKNPRADIKGPFSYALCFDYDVPDYVKRKTDDLPLFINQEIVDSADISPFTEKLMEKLDYELGKHRTLIASDKTQINYMNSLELLQLFIRLGFMKKFHKIYRFNRTKCY